MMSLFAAVVISTVLVPEDSRLTRLEFNRIQPTIEVVSYKGRKTVELAPDAVLVFYVEEPPADRADLKDALAMALYERHRVYVFIKTLETQLRMNRSDPQFRVALGRVLAHEVEHVRRGVPGHDETGFFKACVSREYLLALGAR